MFAWTYDQYVKDRILSHGGALIEIEGDWMESFCPKWATMFPGKRIKMWAELLKAIAKQESGFNPCSMYFEFDIKGSDRVTNKPVIISEGLFQLSYTDVRNYGRDKIPFDFAKDEKVFEEEYARAIAHVSRSNPSHKATNPNRTILDPHLNIDAAIAICSKLVSKSGEAPLSARLGAYWSCLKPIRMVRGVAKPRASYVQIRHDLTAACPECNVPGKTGV